MNFFPAGASFKSWNRMFTSVGPSLRGVTNTFARAPVNAPLKSTLILVSSPFLKFGMPSIGAVYVVVTVVGVAVVGVAAGVVTADTVSPEALLLTGTTVNPSGTAL